MTGRLLRVGTVLGIWLTSVGASDGLLQATVDEGAVPSIRVAMEKLPADFDGRLELENLYSSTNLAACRFEVQLVDFPGPADRAAGRRAFFRRAFNGPHVPGQAMGWLDLELPGNWRDADGLVLTAFDPQGDEIWTWSWFVHHKDHYAEKYVAAEAEEVPQVEVEGVPNEIHLRAGTLVLRFSGNSGELAGVALEGRPVAFGPGPQLIGGRTAPIEVSFSQTDGATVLDVIHAGDMEHVRWYVYPTGWVRLECQYERHGRCGAFGIGFVYPQERVKGVRWLGRSPFPVRKGRTRSDVLDVHSHTDKDLRPGRAPDATEFEGYYRDWNWVTIDTDQAAITIVNATDDLFLGLYCPKEPRSTTRDASPLDIAFLQGIPAVGTRLREGEALGPESAENDAAGRYRTAVWFHFGPFHTLKMPANVRQHTARK